MAGASSFFPAAQFFKTKLEREDDCMTTQRRMFVSVLCALACLSNVIGVAAQSAQDKTPRTREVVVAQDKTVFGGPGAFAFSYQGDNTFVFVSSEMSFDGKVVKAAPYSAQAVTESIQTLADGNRIVRRSTSNIYRDSEGRTRREQTINAVGSYAAAGEPQQTVFINDPVAEVNYILDVKSRTARKLEISLLPMKKRMLDTTKVKEPVETAKAKEGKGGEPGEKTERINVEMRSGGGAVAMAGPMGPAGPGAFERTWIDKFDSKNAKKESLGKQTIEGVEAEGTRFTTTITAGEVGNELPINIVNENWYSEELQTVIMTRFSDPRFGESTYRLTNINRSEPARSLFELPSDYTIKETMGPKVNFVKPRSGDN
jgi:hypothetical protein